MDELPVPAQTPQKAGRETRRLQIVLPNSAFLGVFLAVVTDCWMGVGWELDGS